MTIEADLLASVYEASAIPERWPKALENVAKSCQARGSILICAERGFDRAVASEDFNDIFEEFAQSKWVSDTTRVGGLIEKLPHPGFVSDAMLQTPEDLQNLPIYKEFLVPRGIGAGAATAIYGASGDGIIVTLEGFADHKASNEAVPYLNSLRPHLARASLLSWQLSMQRTQAGLDTLGLIGSAAAALGSRGQLVAANSRFSDLIGEAFVDTGRKLRAHDPGSDEALGIAIDQLLDTKLGKSIAMFNPQTFKTSALHLLPVAGEAHDIFQNASGLVILAKSENTNLPSTDLLESLFDLTPKEAAIGRKIAVSKSVKLIAQEQGVSAETIRWHLKNLMLKAGVNKRSDLIRLITDQAPPDQLTR
ncbi:LuxR family transcriptional regulator [Sphingomonadaceae bacterium]|nr:LuxR family transcriptional regulator [Sphingomonadaceae bacterium]